jgi:hypothetical protein
MLSAMTNTATTDHGQLPHRPGGNGPAFWGPGDSHGIDFVSA